MKIKCPAKINLSLDVVERRPDGYHNLDMIMHTVKLFDILDISAEDSDECKIKISCDNSLVTTDERNICAVATDLFLRHSQLSKSVTIHINKNIPVGAGLGGGSSDGAATLLALNKLCGEPFSSLQLASIAAKVGADVPFFLYGGCCRAQGIGEILTPMPQLENAHFLIAKPKYGISTPYVYKNLSLDENTLHPNCEAVAEAIKTGDLPALGKEAVNVLETVVTQKHPEIEQYKRIMCDFGAVYSLMSGSGSSVFGVFDDSEKIIRAAEEMKKITNQVFIA